MATRDSASRAGRDCQPTLPKQPDSRRELTLPRVGRAPSGPVEQKNKNAYPRWPRAVQASLFRKGKSLRARAPVSEGPRDQSWSTSCHKALVSGRVDGPVWMPSARFRLSTFAQKRRGPSCPFKKPRKDFPLPDAMRLEIFKKYLSFHLRKKMGAAASAARHFSSNIKERP